MFPKVIDIYFDLKTINVYNCCMLQTRATDHNFIYGFILVMLPLTILSIWTILMDVKCIKIAQNHLELNFENVPLRASIISSCCLLPYILCTTIFVNFILDDPISKYFFVLVICIIFLITRYPIIVSFAFRVNEAQWSAENLFCCVDIHFLVHFRSI